MSPRNESGISSIPGIPGVREVEIPVSNPDGSAGSTTITAKLVEWVDLSPNATMSVTDGELAPRVSRFDFQGEGRFDVVGPEINHVEALAALRAIVGDADITVGFSNDMPFINIAGWLSRTLDRGDDIDQVDISDLCPAASALYGSVDQSLFMGIADRDVLDNVAGDDAVALADFVDLADATMWGSLAAGFRL